MHNHGFNLSDGENVRIDIVRSMFDGKMAAIMSGAGGASCQFCTATPGADPGLGKGGGHRSER